jgi:hypothetical protein
MKDLQRMTLLIALAFSAFASTTDVPAGPIYNQEDAEATCPDVCRSSYLIWNGNWNTTAPGEMSVCDCDMSRDFDAGPICDQRDAARRCPNVCHSNGLAWNGNWTTTMPGIMSVCGCMVPRGA